MKYVFVINPTAGDGKALSNLQSQLCGSSEDYEIYITKAEKDATEFVKNYCDNYSGEVCFVACGGDGTLNEVISAIIHRENKYFSLMAYGSGNDFAKYYGNRSFTSVKDLFCGEKLRIDALKVNDRYSVNMINIGLEANVGAHANKVKKSGGKNAYFKGLVHGIFTGRYNKIQIAVDGEVITKKKMLLCSVANGKYAGSKYMCSPISENDDGYLDVCLFHAMSLIKFLSCVGKYERGEHLTYKGIAKKRVYRRGKSVTVDGKNGTALCLDGEMLYGKHFEITVLSNALNFILPKENL